MQHPAGSAAASRADVRNINFSWLLRLRWGSIAGQLVTVLGVRFLMGVALPLLPLGLLIGLELATNLFLLGRRNQPVPEWLPGAVMVLDVLVLTGLLYFTGGPFNPFSFLYLVEIALAAVVLRPRWTWVLVGLSLLCSAILFLYHRELPELTMHHGSHSMLPVWVHLYGMWVAFGVAAGFIVYFLLRVTAALSQREAELAQAELARARTEKLASLATLAAGTAHELATPLSTIAVVAKELERALDAARFHPDAIEDARLIREQVARCRAILDQMAADAGETAGEQPRPVALEELLHEATDGLRAEPRVRIEIDPAAGGARLLPSRALARAVRGLVKNAQEATGQGEVLVRALAPGAELHIEVRDAGTGMTAEVLARAGEPFFTTKPPGRGMGLGLFLTRAVLDRLGGRLELDSTPGAGTRASVIVPCTPIEVRS